MGLKDRFRRVTKRTVFEDDNRSSSPSSSNSSTSNILAEVSTSPVPSIPATGTSTPTSTSAPIPSITLSKTTTTSSRLSKRLTWGRLSKLTPEEREAKKLEEWRRHDEKAWDEPMPARYRGKSRKSQAHQDILRGFEMRFGCRESLDGRSMFSGISPGASRAGSVRDTRSPRQSFQMGRKFEGSGPLSREVSRSEVAHIEIA